MLYKMQHDNKRLHYPNRLVRLTINDVAESSPNSFLLIRDLMFVMS